MSILASTFRWLQRKRYQYEVTFSLYMLTPTEKFIFNSFIFLFISMIVIAASLYLPHHIAFLTNRAWFYYHGDESSYPSASTLLSTTATAIAQAAAGTATGGKGVNVPGMAEGLSFAARKPGSTKGWGKGEL